MGMVELRHDRENRRTGKNSIKEDVCSQWPFLV